MVTSQRQSISQDARTLQRTTLSLSIKIFGLQPCLPYQTPLIRYWQPPPSVSVFVVMLDTGAPPRGIAERAFLLTS
jgi:hypothetical protein